MGFCKSQNLKSIKFYGLLLNSKSLKPIPTRFPKLNSELGVDTKIMQHQEACGDKIAIIALVLEILGLNGRTFKRIVSELLTLRI